MSIDHKHERLRAVADLCARMAAPGVVDRLGTAGTSYVLAAAREIVDIFGWGALS